MNPVLVRPADAEEVLDLRHRVLRPGRPRDAARFEGDVSPRARHWVAVGEDRIIGVASVLPFPPPGEAEPPWQLRGMAVAPELQGRGVGGALLVALQRDVDAPMWCNARLGALDFYLGHGWTVWSEVFDVPGIGPHHRLRWQP